MPYDFTRSVQDPRDIYPQGYGAKTDSTSAAIGTALSGLANIFDMGIKAAAENKLDKRLNDFDNEINPYVQAVGQGRMKTDDAFARTTAKLKTYIDRHPHLADEYRKRAQDIWGVNPSAELTRLAGEKEAVDRKRKQDVDNYNLNKANEYGAIPLDEETGQPDYESGIAVGRELAQYESNVSAASAEADLELKRRRLNGEGDPLSLEDQRKVRELSVSRAVRPLIATNIKSHIDNIPALLKTLENPKDADSVAVGQRLVEQSYTTTRESVIRILNEQTDMDSTTYNNILGMVDSAYASYRGRTPSMIKAANDIVGLRGDIARDRAAHVIPDVMDMIAIGGQAAVSAAFGQFDMGLSQEAADYRSDKQGRILQFSKGFRRVQEGNIPPPDPGDPQSESDLANGVKASADQSSKNPDAIPETGLPAFGNSIRFIADRALDSNDPNDYIAATTSTNSAGTARALERLKGKAPDVYNDAVQKILELNIQWIGQLGRQGNDTQEVTEEEPTLDSEGMYSPLGRGASTVSIRYNAEKGVIEPVGLKTGMTLPRNMKKVIDSFNSSLRTVIRYKDQTLDSTKDMSDQELKLNLVKMSGIKITGKTPESKDENALEAEIVDDDVEVGVE